jgi:hypothetical protein
VVGVLETIRTVFAYLFRYGNKDSHIVASGSKPITAFQMLGLLVFALSNLKIVTYFDPYTTHLFGIMIGFSISRVAIYSSCYWGKIKRKRKLKKERSELESETNIAA